MQPAKNPIIERHNNIRQHFQTLVETDKVVNHHHIHTHEHIIKFDVKDLDKQLDTILERDSYNQKQVQRNMTVADDEEMGTWLEERKRFDEAGAKFIEAKS